MVYVTHDQTEAMTLSTELAVLRDGIIQQVGKPDAVYAKPANLFGRPLHRQPVDEHLSDDET